MKNYKKIASFAIAAVMSLGLLAPISTPVAKAADVNITVDTDNNAHEFVAYQIIAGDFVELDNELVIDETASIGSGVNEAALKTALGLEADATIADIAAALESKGSVAIIKALESDGVLTETSIALTDGTNTVAQGYYYIVDNKGDAATMLKVVDDTLTIEPKTTEEATLEKDVKTGEDTWGDATSAEAGDVVDFKVSVTLPSNLDDYANFYFYLEDTLTGCLTFDETKLNATYQVVGADGSVKATVTGGITATVEDDKNVRFDCTSVDGITSTEEYDIQGGDTIVVYYSAVFAADGDVNVADNANEVTLYYVNDPDTDGDGVLDSKDDDDDNDGTPDDEDDDDDGDDTPDDEEDDDDEYIVTDPEIVVVVSYTLSINKVDSEDTTITLEGAKFQIKNEAGEYAIAENGVITGWTTDVAAATEFVTNENGAFAVAGLGSGTYTLVETKAPAGYNGAGSEFVLTIDAGFENGELVDLTIQAGDADAEDGDVTNATVETTITNTKGSTLPSTGGIGTVIFSVVGGVLVIGAAVLLITKKRANNEEI